VAWAAGVIRDNAHQALDELRSVITVARGTEPAGAPERPQPTLADVPALLEESRQAGLAVSLRQSPDVVEHGDELPAVSGRALYRIVQEALTNVRKHAASSAAAVEFTGRPGERIEVSVRNRCVAAASELPPGPGTGLIGLRERTTLAGGGLDCGPTTDGDFLVRAWLPWSAPTRAGR
jgi:signal transduction histidine kinase